MENVLHHDPVMLEEVLLHLDLQEGNTALDVTLGLAGHSKEFAKKIGETGLLIGIDADQTNLEYAQEQLSDFPCSKKYIHANFLDIAELDLPPVDYIFADLGLSSPHLDDGTRGFSFRKDAPLDLRYDQTKGITAAELLKKSTEQEIFLILKKYAEVSGARRLAQNIKSTVPETTFQLKQCIEDTFGYKAKNILPQVFQALRIAINHELDALDVLLDFFPNILKPGGRVAIMSYHSLEDRRVKKCFKLLSTPEKDDLTGAISKEADFLLINKKPIMPIENEIHRNQRSRSAKLRILLKRNTP